MPREDEQFHGRVTLERQKWHHYGLTQTWEGFSSLSPNIRERLDGRTAPVNGLNRNCAGFGRAVAGSGALATSPMTERTAYIAEPGQAAF
jgi:hypothetical protein